MVLRNSIANGFFVLALFVIADGILLVAVNMDIFDYIPFIENPYFMIETDRFIVGVIMMVSSIFIYGMYHVFHKD